MKQEIIRVDSWDGSASNYSTAESYADASLLNFNPVAGMDNDPENWTKSLIKLPVRREGDPKDSYVDKAVFAASGGRGISRVEKPSEVSQEDFDRLMKRAGNELITAYREMDQIAPQNVYDIAGKERPESQAISFEKLYGDVYEALYLIDDALGTFSRLIDIYLTDDKNVFAIVAQDGKLYKQHFIVENDELSIGDFEEIDIDNKPSMTSFNIIQQEDGKYRWLGIAATTALNKNGNFNSKQLYDSFIEHIEETGEYPVLNFYHQPNTRLGVADFAARDENLYILSGTFDDNEFGIAAAKGLQENPDYWGQSIEFWYRDYEWYETDVDNVTVKIPLFKTGVNDFTSILPAKEAACLRTSINSKNNNGGLSMNEKVKSALQLLLGSDELADTFEKLADDSNQDINENTIHQSVEEDEIVEEVEDVEEDETDTEENEDIVLDENFIDELLTDLVDHDGFVQTLQTIVEPLVNRLKRLEVEIVAVKQANQALELSLQENLADTRQEWENNQPRGRKVSYRARGEQLNGSQPKQKSFANTANNTLNKIKTGVR